MASSTEKLEDLPEGEVSEQLDNMSDSQYVHWIAAFHEVEHDSVGYIAQRLHHIGNLLKLYQQGEVAVGLRLALRSPTP